MIGSGSCVVVGPEIPEYQVQGEAVIIRFPFLEDAINYKSLQVDNSSTFHIDHINLRNQSSLKSCRDRVKQSGRGVQLLPSHPSDSGTFTYTLRSDLIDVPCLSVLPVYFLNFNSGNEKNKINTVQQILP